MKIRLHDFRLSLCVLSVMTIASCTSPGATTTTPAGFPTTSGVTTDTFAPTTTTASDGECGVDGTPIEDGLVANVVESASDAEQIASISWETSTGCEVFTIEFATDQGAPATTPPSLDAQFIREAGVLRVVVGVEMTAVTEQLVESAMVGHLFVVRQADRRLFVDLHLTDPARAIVVADSSPGRVTITLQPGGSEYGGTPAIGPNVVVLVPLAGPVASPIEVNGYSRNFEANTIGRISQGSNVLAEGFTTAADWAETWGEFSLTLGTAGSGPADLFVGEQSAQDGSDRGVVIPIDLA
jgi:hypothetical protein